MTAQIAEAEDEHDAEAPQTQGSLIVLPPKAPPPPRAIFQATCGPSRRPPHLAGEVVHFALRDPDPPVPTNADLHELVAASKSASVVGFGG